MDKEIEAFRKRGFSLAWEGGQGRRRYPGGMKAKALQLAAALRKRGLTMAVAAKAVGHGGIHAVCVEETAEEREDGAGGRIVSAAKAAPSALPITTVRLLSPRDTEWRCPTWRRR